MIGDRRVNRAVYRFIVGQTFRLGDLTDIGIEMMLKRIAVVVSFIGADRLFIPFTGEYALAADRLEPLTNAANTGKKIDKTKFRIIIMGGTGRQQPL